VGRGIWVGAMTFAIIDLPVTFSKMIPNISIEGQYNECCINIIIMHAG